MASTSTLEYALIGLIRQKPQTGYDLRKTFATGAMRHYSDSPGSIYPALKRLEARGWIAAAPGQGEQADPRKRQEFTLTAAGKEALVAWIEQPVTRNDTMLRLSELMLRFAFMDGNVPRTVTARFLAEFERELAAYVAELRVKFDELSSNLPLHTGVLAFESGIEGMELQVAWARRSRERLERATSEALPPAVR